MQNLLQDWTLYADWSKYELVMFNIMQNAVKYNMPEGKIIIIMKIAQTFDFKQGAMIETHIVDTGQGIDPKRQRFLFKPFMELKAKQNFSKVKDRTTGIGLANSKDIAAKLDGDVFITTSEPKFTVFSTRIPIEAVFKPESLPPRRKISQELEQVNLDSFDVQPAIKNFLEFHNVQYLEKFNFSEGQTILKAKTNGPSPKGKTVSSKQLQGSYQGIIKL